MTLIRPLLLLAFASVAFIQGCATSKHDIAKAEAGQVSVCTKCYDQIKTVRDNRGGRFASTGTRTSTTHMCEDCKNEMAIYEKDGVMMVRCATCAPEGVDCDRCVPKK